MAVTARTGDERRPPRGQPAQIRRRRLHAVNGETPANRRSRCRPETEPATRPARPRRVPGVHLLEQRAPRSAARPDELDLFRRLGHVDAARHERVAIDGSADRAQDQRRDRVRRMRRKGRADTFGRHERVDLPARVLDERVRIGRVEANQLVEDDRRERLRDSGPKVTSVLLMSPRTAVPAAAASSIARSTASRISGVGIGALPPSGKHAANPGCKGRSRRDLVAQIRQLEVRVRVDQPGHDGHIAAAKIDVALARLPARPDPRRPIDGDAAAIDRHPPVTNRRLADRQDPRGVITNHPLRNDASFRFPAGASPAVLRAG